MTRNNSFQKSIEEAKQISELVSSLSSSLSQLINNDGAVFDQGYNIPGKDSSFADIFSRLNICIGHIVEFKATQRVNLIPLSLIQRFEKSTSELKAALLDLTSHVDAIIYSWNGLKSFDYGSFVAMANGGQSVNLTAQFSTLFDKTESILTRYFEISPILRPKNTANFQAASASLSTLVVEISDTLSASKSDALRVKKVFDEVEARREAAVIGSSEISRMKNDAAGERQAISESLTKVTAERAEVKSVVDEVAELKAVVRSYKPEFETFDAELQRRNESFVELTRLNEEIVDTISKRKSIDGLIERSIQMLSKATVAGLASNFKEMTDKLTIEMNSARYVFYFGIVLLFISAIPLLFIVLAPLINFIIAAAYPNLSGVLQFEPQGTRGGFEYIGHVVSRVVILVPAAWFVSFAAIRHSSLFRLREHYAYKYSMAVAVEGFRGQAPLYKEEIAALVLEQLAFNPADKLIPSREIKEGQTPGVMTYLLGKLRNRGEKVNPAES